MAEIASVRSSNGLSLVSTFSGCGGSCLGFEMAGYRVLWANEFVPAARNTYALNHPDTVLDLRDIRQVTADDILAATGLKVGELDVLEGSPPCASFSASGNREKSWGKVKKYSDVEQRVDDLFFEYARLVEGLRPRAFVAENVSGLVRGSAWGYFEEIIRALRRCGYRVRAKVLDAQWLGVPQTRARLIFIGVRDDIAIEPPYPTPLRYRYSIRDALPHLRSTDKRGVGDIQFPKTEGNQNFRTGKVWSGDRPAPTVMSDTIGGADARVVAPPLLEGLAIGREWNLLKPGVWSERYQNLIKPDANLPVPCVTATGGTPGAASVTHPFEPRKFTIPELLRLCSFPDDFALTGTYRQQWERLGRSVPPVMMFHVARTLRDQLFAKLERVSADAREAKPT